MTEAKSLPLAFVHDQLRYHGEGEAELFGFDDDGHIVRGGLNYKF